MSLDANLLFIPLAGLAAWIGGCARTQESTKETERTASPLPAGSEWINSLGMVFKVIPPGEFSMEIPEKDSGRPHSLREAHDRKVHGFLPLPPLPRRPVRITKPYAISICEVTFGQFEKVTGMSLPRMTSADEPAFGMTVPDVEEFCRRLSDFPEEKSAGRT